MRKEEKYLPLTKNILGRLHEIGLEGRVSGRKKSMEFVSDAGPDNEATIIYGDPFEEEVMAPAYETEILVYQNPIKIFDKEDKASFLEILSSELSFQISILENGRDWRDEAKEILRDKEDILASFETFSHVYSHLGAMGELLVANFKDLNITDCEIGYSVRSGDPRNSSIKIHPNSLNCTVPVGNFKGRLDCDLNGGYPFEEVKTSGVVYHEIRFIPTIQSLNQDTECREFEVFSNLDSFDLKELSRNFPAGIGERK